MSQSVLRKRREFQELERHWYDRLKAESFPEIENTQLPGRPLKRWHSFDLLDERHQAHRVLAAEYQRAAETLLNEPRFQEVCESVAYHGNSVSVAQVRSVWEFHVQGLSERRIAVRLCISKTCVHKALVKFRTWMRLL